MEFGQVRRAIDRLRCERQGGYDTSAIKREDVVDLLLPYVEGYKAPDPHAPPAPAVTA